MLALRSHETGEIKMPTLSSDHTAASARPLTLKERIAAACPVYTDFKTTPDGHPVDFVDIWGLSGTDPDLWNEMVTHMAEELKKSPVDILYGLEARGFHFAGALAEASQMPFEPVRKAKLNSEAAKRVLADPAHPLTEKDFKTPFPSATIVGPASSEYTAGEFIAIRKRDITGLRAAIIDDLLATGGTGLGAARLIEAAGGKPALLLAPVYVDGLQGIEKLEQRGIKVSTLISVSEIMDLREQMGLDRTRTREPNSFLLKPEAPLLQKSPDIGGDVLERG